METGLLCALFAIIDLFLFATYKGTNYHLSICIELSKVYSNSMLTILNSRAQIRYISPNEMSHNISDIVFRSGTKVGVSVESNHSSLGLSPSEPYGPEDEETLGA
ncbi:hypothetical protein B0H19DRAFT_1139243 [Mycena capillaripes]|nr:hypothetical protein B0H19DRAFT_1139243 [Mycena capillaripes]